MPSNSLPAAMAETFYHCASAAERCIAAYLGVEGLAEVTQRAYECATLCRSAASMLATEASLGTEATRLAVSSAMLCDEACSLQTELLCRQCSEACRECVRAYREAAGASTPETASLFAQRG